MCVVFADADVTMLSVINNNREGESMNPRSAASPVQFDTLIGFRVITNRVPYFYPM